MCSISRGIALPTTAAQNKRLSIWRFSGYSRSDPTYFILLIGAIWSASIGLLPLDNCKVWKYMLSPTGAFSHAGWPCKGQGGAHHHHHHASQQVPPTAGPQAPLGPSPKHSQGAQQELEGFLFCSSIIGLWRAAWGQRRGALLMGKEAGGGEKQKGSQTLRFTAHSWEAPRCMGPAAPHIASKDGNGCSMNYHCVIPR